MFILRKTGFVAHVK
jgi:hypothetical protein